MTSRAEAEYERVRTTYPLASRREVAIYAVLFGLAGVAGIFVDVAWVVMIGGVSGFVGWEFTKWRLRRNARDFAQAMS